MHAARMKEILNTVVYILVGLPDGKRLNEISKSQSEVNIKLDLNVHRRGGCEMDMFGSEWGPAMNCCEFIMNRGVQ